MAEMLSFPFRILPNGRAATVEQSSPQGVAEQVLHLVATRPYERPVVPAYGTPDPAFIGITAGQVSAGLDIYGPPVQVLTVAARPVTRSAQKVQVTFDV